MQIVNPLLPVYTFPIPADITKIKALSNGIYTDMLRDAPTRVSINEGKTFNTQRTIGTWVTAHWGENIPQLQAQGNIIDYPGQEGLTFLSLFVLRSLYKLDKQPIGHAVSRIMGFITSSATIAGTSYSKLIETGFANYNANRGIVDINNAFNLYKYVERIIRLKDTNLAPTYFFHDNNIYQGYFADFQYTRDIQNPRFIQYNFRVNIEWNSNDYLIDVWKNQDSLTNIVSVTGII